MLEEWRLGAVEPHLPAWRNWIACTPSKREVASSSLVAGWEGGVVGLFGVGGGRAPNYGGVGGRSSPQLRGCGGRSSPPFACVAQLDSVYAYEA